ncbi:hypothetical protein [Mammaliicoccus sciuri]|uniref:hypothetical protein n=1 Tax=Mammaliicoccus sciuri TaxID=1296 RepID=UPI001C4EA36C|nr:hypothetical protein [Mammaliicoccus sciuri]
MPKIRVEKEMNLGELLCWAIENKEQAKYRDFRSESMRVRFNGSGLPEIIFDKQFLPIYETFVVRTKEEITEDTVIPKLLVKFKSPSRYQVFSNDYINGFEVEEGDIEACYILNDDLTMTLIWTKEKGLVK